MIGRDGLSSEFIDADDDADALQVGGMPEKHGVRLAWPVRPCSLVGEYVVAVSDNDSDNYNPFSFYSPYGSSRHAEGYHSLYVRLARAGGVSPDELLEFCRAFGLPDYPREYWNTRRWDHGDGPGAVIYPLSRVQTLADVIAGWSHLLGVAAEGEWQAARQELAPLLECARPLYEPTAWVYGHRSETSLIPDFPCYETDDTSDDESAGSEADEDESDAGPEHVWLYWTGERCGDTMWIARQWGVEWDGRALGDVTREYWDDYSEVVQCEGRQDEPGLDSFMYNAELLRKPPEAVARSAIRDALSYLRKLGDPDARSHETLQSALIAMVLRDASGGGRFVVCRECGMPFYARDARQRFCPPDLSTGNPKGCAKRKADREAQRRRRHPRLKS
jgi:hypothetical protein